jgi:hypothetical protein
MSPRPAQLLDRCNARGRCGMLIWRLLRQMNELAPPVEINLVCFIRKNGLKIPYGAPPPSHPPSIFPVLHAPRLGAVQGPPVPLPAHLRRSDAGHFQGFDEVI